MLSELAFAFVSASCFAPRADNFVVQAGSGQQVDVAGAGWEVPMDQECLRSDRARAGLLFRIDEWRGRNAGGRKLLDASVTPFLRYELGRPLGTPVLVEGGVGVNLLSRTRIDEQRRFSTAFQFGEFVGMGVEYGERRQYQIGARLQHVSNGGIKRPNDGLTYGMVLFNYRF